MKPKDKVRTNDNHEGVIDRIEGDYVFIRFPILVPGSTVPDVIMPYRPTEIVQVINDETCETAGAG